MMIILFSLEILIGVFYKKRGDKPLTAGMILY